MEKAIDDELAMNDEKIETELKTLDQLQSACTGCGLCLEGCATYQLSGWEHESPRGRILLAAQFMNGRIEPESAALSTFDRCIGCHACESLCPQNVAYHAIRNSVQEIRSQLNRSMKPAMAKSLYKQWLKLAYRIGKPLWRRYGARLLSIPGFFVKSYGSSVKKIAKHQKQEPILAFCCMQDLYQHDVIEEVLELMRRLGHPLKVDKSQPCCGAIFERLVHGGEESVVYFKEREKAARLQNEARLAFLKWLPPNSSFLAKGCHAFISTHAPQAIDLYQMIEKIVLEKELQFYFPEPKEVFYQPYCRSGAGNQDPIWRLLHLIKGLRIRLLPNPRACCGGYCGETLLHPDLAASIAAQKMEGLPPEATLIITSPDCWGLFHRFQNSAEEGIKILYPFQLFAQAQIKSPNFER